MDIQGTSGYRISTPPLAGNPSTSDKAAEYVTSVIPTAVQIGLKELATLKEASTVHSATTVAAETAGTASKAARGLGVSGWLGAAGSALSVIGGIAGAYDIVSNWGKSSPTAGAASGAAVGAAIGSFIVPGVGTAIGAAAGALAGGLLGSIHTGKHADQKLRDNVRATLVQAGVVDKNFQLPLADGTTFNIGTDGGPKAELNGRRPFEVDTSNPLSKYAVSWLNPLIEFLSQGNQKVQTDFVGYFANAALSNATSLDDVKKNVSSFIARFGVTDDSLSQAVLNAGKSGTLSPEVAAIYLNGIKERTDPIFQG